MIGNAALGRTRVGALVIGEDLGIGEPWVRDYLCDPGCWGPRFRGSSSTATVHGAPLPAERWREYCLSTVTTHDLPPTAGYLDGEHVRPRAHWAC